MALARFELHMTAAGIGSRIVVNGADIADHVRSLTLRSHAREITTLSLEMMGDAVIDGEGIVEVTRPGADDDLAALILQWLDEIDPDDLQAEALTDAPLNVGPVDAVLIALRKRAAAT